MLRLRLQLPFILLLLLLSACADPLTPQERAEAFWTAIESNDANAVRKHVTTAESAALKSLDNVLDVTNVTLKRIIIDGSVATIDTTVTVASDTPLDFPLKTHLIREGEQWKVDYQKTMAAVANANKLASVINKVQEFGNSLQQGIERSVEELEQTLPQIEQELSRIEGQIKQHVPELRQRLERFTNELQEALKNPPQLPGQTEPEAAKETEDGSLEI